MFEINVLVKGLLIEAIIEWIIGIRGIMLTWNLKLFFLKKHFIRKRKHVL
jgi:hypothetical protein